MGTDSAFDGAVLAGGRARRMGRDKALLPIEGIPMATRVAHAMQGAGAREVYLIGGDPATLSALGLRLIPDATPHEGPLAGIIAALRAATETVVVVTACDMPWIGARHVARLVEGRGPREVAISAADGRLQPLHSAWHRSSLAKLEAVFRSGERSVLGAIRGLDASVVDLGAGSWSIDLDTPGDVASASAPRD